MENDEGQYPQSGLLALERAEFNAKKSGSEEISGKHQFDRF